MAPVLFCTAYSVANLKRLDSLLRSSLDREWWCSYRRELEDRFRQDRIIIRTHQIELL